MVLFGAYGWNAEASQLPAAQLDPSGKRMPWYSLFVMMDDDGSGKMTYHELRDMVRGELRLSSALRVARSSSCATSTSSTAAASRTTR